MLGDFDFLESPLVTSKSFIQSFLIIHELSRIKFSTSQNLSFPDFFFHSFFNIKIELPLLIKAKNRW